MPKKKEFNIFELDFTEAFDEVDKVCKLKAGNRKLGEPLSTGILDLDLKMGGGLFPGCWYEFFGAESSGKTTALYHTIGSALNIPRKNKGIFINGEGSIDKEWFTSITGFHPDIVFGKKGNNGNWVVRPQIRHYKPTIGEIALELLKKSLRKYPDKECINDKWYFVFRHSTAKNIKKSGGYTKDQVKKIVGNSYDKELLNTTGDYYIPVPNNYGGPEFFVGVDSWPTLVPGSISDDDSDALGAKARMYAKYVDDIKCLIINKQGVLLGINQMREKPMVMGNPESTPCGNALKHAADCRARFGSISSKGINQGPVEKDGGSRYRWFNYRTTKNKLFVAYKDGVSRWCIQRDFEVGDGCDLETDLYNYLKSTSQLKVYKSNYKITIGKKELKVSSKKFKNREFQFKLKQRCLKQLKSGRAVKLFLKGI